MPRKLARSLLSQVLSRRSKAMSQLSAHFRARIAALGELSRPLGEARAANLARQLAADVMAEISRGRNPDRAAHAHRHGAPGASKRVTLLKDLLPEIALTQH